MSIDPLQAAGTYGRATGLAGERGTRRTAFEAVLTRLGAAGGEPAVRDEEVAAELLRIEMMHSSLAIAGDGAPSEPVSSPALSAILKGLSRFAEHAPRGTEPPPLLARPPAVTAEGNNGAITRTAEHFLGIPYRFGGESAAGIDCSSFVQQVFREHRVELPRTAREQIKVGNEVAQEDLREGDLVFFSTYASYPSHVGIYLGNGKMMHASSREGEVTVSEMNSDYFRSRYLGARRVA